MTVAAMSSGRVARSVPLPDLPTAVRTELTMTTSFMRLLLAVSYWLPAASTWYLVLGTRPAFAALVFRSPDHRLNRSADSLIPQRLAGLQGELNSFLGFLLAAQRLEGFALQVEQILLADRHSGRDVAAKIGRASCRERV